MNELEHFRQGLQEASYDGVVSRWELIESAFGNAGRAWLGRNDRFYMLAVLLHRVDVMHPWLYARCREVEAAKDGYLDLWAREHYKDLADDTPMLTHNRGWTTHGDLVAGDTVYGADGEPVQVLAVTDGYVDSECYHLTFSDGAQLVAGAGHQWRVRRKIRRRVANGRQVEWAEEMSSTNDLPERADVGTMTAPITGAPAQLPIDPYVLGAWLGDGSTGGSRITSGLADAGEMEALLRSRGIAVTRSEHSNSVLLRLGDGVHGKRNSSTFTNALRELGVFRNKHVPELYLRASAHQRLMLLRGLMDTDGSCNPKGRATFCNANERVAEGVYELATGLGLRPRLTRRSFPSGVAKAVDGRYHYLTVKFQAHTDRNPFMMARKAVRAIPPSEHRNCRDVVASEPIASVPTRCIQVVGGMYLAGRELIPTHNSTIITFAGIIQELAINPEITVGIFSHTKPVARKFLLQIKAELESNRELQAIYPDVFWADPKNDSNKWSEEKGIVVRRKSNPKEASVEAHGLVDGQPTGAHFLLRVYDDVVTRESVSTPEQVKKTTDAWELSDNLGARGPDGTMRAWHAGTRYSFADTYANIIEKQALKVRLYPATDNGLPNGKPVFLTPEAWADKRLKQGPATIACQQLMNPAAGNEAMFRKEWLSFIDIRPATLNVYIMVDPAHSRKKGSDNTAMAVIGIDAGNNKYLLDGYRHKMGLKQRWEAMSGLRKVWMAQPGVQMVKVGYERYGMLSDLEYFEEQMERTKDAFEITELNWVKDGEQSKDDRVQRLQPDFQSRKFFMAAVVEGESPNQKRIKEQGQGFRVFQPVKRRDHEGNLYSLNKGFLEEYLTYPFSAKKDLIDATSRLYDMEPVTPIIIDERALEPAIYSDGA